MSNTKQAQGRARMAAIAQAARMRAVTPQFLDFIKSKSDADLLNIYNQLGPVWTPWIAAYQPPPVRAVQRIGYKRYQYIQRIPPLVPGHWAAQSPMSIPEMAAIEQELRQRGMAAQVAEIQNWRAAVYAQANSGGFFSSMFSLVRPLLSPVTAIQIARQVAAPVVQATKQINSQAWQIAQHQKRVALRVANKTAMEITTHTPGFHLLPKDVQKTITSTPLIPSTMHELEDRMRENRRLYESKAKYFDPVINQFYQHEQRQDEMNMIQGMLVAAEADYKIHPTPEKYAYIQQLMARLAMLSAQEQHFMHNAKIFAAVVSIVATVFTAGTASGPLFSAWGSFVQAVGQGAAKGIQLAMKIVLSMINKMATLSELQFAQLAEALDAMAKYPPPASLTKPEDQIKYSLSQKTRAENAAAEQKKKEGSLFPLFSGGLTLLTAL